MGAGTALDSLRPTFAPCGLQLEACRCSWSAFPAKSR